MLFNFPHNPGRGVMRTTLKLSKWKQRGMWPVLIHKSNVVAHTHKSRQMRGRWENRKWYMYFWKVKGAAVREWRKGKMREKKHTPQKDL